MSLHRSKKLLANLCLNELKASQGKRVSATVAYGYKKIEGDKEQWYIDEPAAEVVRKIFNLCLAGKGPLQIAKQLEKEKVLVPSAYYDSVGRKHSNPTPANVYGWQSSTVEKILENQQYTGCTVNGKSSTVSYKVHKKIFNSRDDYQIIPHTQEAIIDEQIWLRVQELRKNKRRNTATGRQSLFAGIAVLYGLRFQAAFITKAAEELAQFITFVMWFCNRLYLMKYRLWRILFAAMVLYSA